MRIAVIGAGVAGLVAAYRLGERGHEVDVYERWPGLGGQAATIDVGDGLLLERYYHHFFTSDVHIAALYKELGLGIEWVPSSVAVFAEGRSWPFTSPGDLLRFSPMPLRARVRMGAAVVGLQRFGKELEPYERMTAKEWILKRMGRHAWEKVWGPMLRGKFGSRAEDISMAWLWAKFTTRRQIKGEEARQEKLGYPVGSYEPFYTELRRRIEGFGGRVLIDRPAHRLSRVAGRLSVTAGAPDSFRRGHDPRSFDPDGSPEAYDTVIATVPSDVFLQLLNEDLAREVGDEYLSRVRSAEYHAALCLLLELDRQFSPFYWTNVADPRLPFIGLIEQTNLIPPERYGGRRFLYVANYVDHDDPLLSLSMDELLDRYEDGLILANPGWSRDWVVNAWLHREAAAQPIVTHGHRDRMPALRTPAEGLVLANTQQIYPEDRGTNYSVRLGDQVAAEVAG